MVECVLGFFLRIEARSMEFNRASQPVETISDE